jgi:hypothetical protein
MKSKEVTTTVYIADDGKEFLTENECKTYEKEVLQNLKWVKYFRVKYNPDLTETGNYQNEFYVAVYSRYGFHKNLLFMYLIEERGFHVLQQGVMGYGFMQSFKIITVGKTEFEQSKYDVQSIFLSPMSLEGFPPNVDYMVKWNFK